MTWKFRIQASEEGVHRPPVAGIAGTGLFQLLIMPKYRHNIVGPLQRQSVCSWMFENQTILNPNSSVQIFSLHCITKCSKFGFNSIQFLFSRSFWGGLSKHRVGRRLRGWHWRRIRIHLYRKWRPRPQREQEDGWTVQRSGTKINWIPFLKKLPKMLTNLIFWTTSGKWSPLRAMKVKT